MINKKICVLANTGNAGKTTISRYLLHPRMPKADVFSIETRNQSMSDLGIKNVKIYTGEQLQQLIEDLMFSDSAIIDVGTSNIDSFFREVKKMKGGIDEFDLIIVPVVPEDKSDAEAVKLYLELQNYGVNEKKIIFLPNRIKDNTNPKDVLPELYQTVKFNPSVFFPEERCIEFLSSIQKSIEDLIEKGGLNGEKYREAGRKARKAGDEKGAIAYTKLYSNFKYAVPLKEKLDFIFKEIIKDK